MSRDRYQILFDPAADDKYQPDCVLPVDYKTLKKTLTKKQLDAYELVYVYGFTQQKAARKLGIAQQVLGRHLSKAVSRLKKHCVPGV